MDVNLRQIRAFLAVARFGSFTRAAASLNVSQPTLTVQIRRLEETLALRLFDRDTRTVSLTRLGREFLPIFERMVGDLDAVMLDISNVAASRRGTVKIATLPSVAASLLPDAIRTFREQHPGAAFVLKDMIAGRVVAAVRAEEVDLGIMGGDVAQPEIEILSQTRDDMHIVFPSGHPIGAAKDVTAALLARFPLVMMDPETSVRAVVDAAFHAAGLIPITACEAIYMMTAVAMVRAGLGIAILPGSAREIRAEPGVVSRPINDPRFSRSITLIKRAGRTLPPLSATFANHLMNALTDKSASHRRTQKGRSR